jgi:hypothetical protein
LYALAKVPIQDIANNIADKLPLPLEKTGQDPKDSEPPKVKAKIEPSK